MWSEILAFLLGETWRFICFLVSIFSTLVWLLVVIGAISFILSNHLFWGILLLIIVFYVIDRLDYFR